MEQEQRVVVVDVNMKFGTMVIFLVKLAIAFIPAAFILFFVGLAIAMVFGGLSSGIRAELPPQFEPTYATCAA
jgi:hypothetical protein